MCYLYFLDCVPGPHGKTINGFHKQKYYFLLLFSSRHKCDCVREGKKERKREKEREREGEREENAPSLFGGCVNRESPLFKQLH